MPKDGRERSISLDRDRVSPLRCDSSRILHSYLNPNINEWEEARCPVCMEHPHNSILLICSSYENGCRPYMCDTSYQHSNCFYQFYKASKEAGTSTSTQEAVTNLPAETTNGAHDSTTVNPREGSITEGDEGSTILDSDQDEAKPKLTCPYCRGDIKKWVVNVPARCFMNSKLRLCSCETCDFNGTYSDLRNHARVQHPTHVRPSKADPERPESINPRTRSSSSWSGASSSRSQVGVRRKSGRFWGESYVGDTGTSSRDDASNLSYVPSVFSQKFCRS